MWLLKEQPGVCAAVYRHVNGLMLDDPAYAADMLLRLSAGQDALWTQAAWHAHADAPAACWFAPPHHHKPPPQVIGCGHQPADQRLGACTVPRLVAGWCCCAMQLARCPLRDAPLALALLQP